MLTLPLKKDIETKEILKKSIRTNSTLSKLNGIVKIIPNELILINALALQEAKDSSEIENISILLNNTQNKIKTKLPKIYGKDLVEILFLHPYTKIDTLVSKLGITRQTASKYLKELEKIEILKEEKRGRNRYFINIDLFEYLKKAINE